MRTLRKEFEKSVQGVWPDRFDFERESGDDYCNEMLENMWWAWQVRFQIDQMSIETLMSDEEKLLHMFKLKEGEMTGACSAVILYSDEGEPNGVGCQKDGGICWSRSREDLIFAFVTREM